MHSFLGVIYEVQHRMSCGDNVTVYLSVCLFLSVA